MQLRTEIQCSENSITYKDHTMNAKSLCVVSFYGGYINILFHGGLPNRSSYRKTTLSSKEKIR